MLLRYVHEDDHLHDDHPGCVLLLAPDQPGILSSPGLGPQSLEPLMIPTHPLLYEQLQHQRLRHYRDEDRHNRSSLAVCLFSGAHSQPYLLQLPISTQRRPLIETRDTQHRFWMP